ncbi:hypothetical protein OUZ56_002713 [Daphnia magna]|uniref:Uncharacterized protein n=1 Tax=Daphnia magna TaxID=35525 RepID=A0ABR0A6I3_9CRUS|nr:hypothetical protein OUZ56_002713 [Daphnia magna]
MAAKGKMMLKKAQHYQQKGEKLVGIGESLKALKPEKQEKHKHYEPSYHPPAPIYSPPAPVYSPPAPVYSPPASAQSVSPGRDDDFSPPYQYERERERECHSSKNVSRQLTATFYADTTTRAQQRRTEAVVKRAAAFVCRVWRFNECFLSHNHELV